VVLESIDVVKLNDRCEVVWQLCQRGADFFSGQP
jgi:hypothetical protein